MEDLGLVVVDGDGPSLLGRDWLGRFRVDWGEVHELRLSPGTLESLLAKHANLFGNELGTIRGVTANRDANWHSPARLWRVNCIADECKRVKLSPNWRNKLDKRKYGSGAQFQL